MANFTPQQIEEFLQEFFDTVGARQYVGARYVPIFGRAGSDTVEWDDTAPYEPLTVVMHEGVSYVSRRYVPTGIQIDDTDYWVQTYRFDAQVEQYRQEVLRFQDEIDANAQAIQDLETTLVNELVPFPESPDYSKYGTLGQVLMTLANGKTMWNDPVVVTSEIAGPLIQDWLDDHPEATTTVQDGSITDQKINADASILRWANVTSVTDLNAWLSPGFTVLPFGVAIANCPIQASARRMCVVYRITSQYLVQTVWDVLRGGAFYSRWTTDRGSTWGPWLPITPATGTLTDDMLANASSALRRRDPNGITDLNDVSAAGYYMLAYDATIANCPLAPNRRRLLTVYSIATDFVAQAIVDLDYEHAVYYRVKSSGQIWPEWERSTVPDGAVTDATVNADSSLLRLRDSTGVTDLNAWLNPGFLMLPYTSTIANCPIPANTRRLLTVYRITTNYYVQSVSNTTGDGSTYFRASTDHGVTWSSWVRYALRETPDLATMLEYPQQSTANAYNAAYEDVTLMTYNVAHYNNDTSAYISDEKIANLKQMFAEYAPDVICIQEGLGWIDAESTVRYENALLYPSYNPYDAGSAGLGMWARVGLSITGVTNGHFTSDRAYKHGTLSLGSHDVSLYNTHPYPGATTEAVDYRHADWTELKAILDADTATYKVVCGDFNTNGDTDYFETIFGTDYYLANGGYLGWYATASTGTELGLPCDNIIVSKNINIEMVKPLSRWYRSLYSDHVPVLARIRLLH